MNLKLPQLRNEAFVNKMAQYLTPEEQGSLTVYVESGGSPLSISLATGLFELFLNGSSCMEIWKLNKTLPQGAILDARIRYDWDKARDEYAFELHSKIREKVVKAQLETTELMTDMLTAAKKKHGDKIKKYIQTGDETHLQGVLGIDNIMALSKMTESLMKITGQDKVGKDEKKLVDLNRAEANAPRNAGPGGKKQISDVKNTKLDSEDAAKILEIFVEADKKSGK